jgi:hypothetical protein
MIPTDFCSTRPAGPTRRELAGLFVQAPRPVAVSRRPIPIDPDTQILAAARLMIVLTLESWRGRIP